MGVGDVAGGADRSVIVVGAGPTGLLLAGDLAAAGVPVTLVEKRAPGISNLSRAMVLHARTLEQLDSRTAPVDDTTGLTDTTGTTGLTGTPGLTGTAGAIGTTGGTPDAAAIRRVADTVPAPSGSIADELVAKGQPLDNLRLFMRLAMRLDTLPSRYNFVLVLPQYEVEAALERRAVAAGVRFAHHTEVTGLTQDADGVTLTVRGPDGQERTQRAAYVVGTDGLHSAVRHAVGLPFPGKSVIRSVVLADVRLARPPETLLTVNANGDAFAFLAPFADGYYRLIGWHRQHDVPDSAPLELDEIKEITRLALGDDYGMHDARWVSRFHSDERQAPAYRVGRVFLAGDAAHVHTPAGGQGMNTGLQDAANLSWKLAAVLDGRAPERLLDSYQAERHPVGRAVLRSSGGLVRLAMAKRPWTLAARAAITAFLNVAPPVRAKAIGQITGIGYAYRAPRGAHPLTGKRMPDVPLAGGARLYEALRDGRFVLVAPADADFGEPAAHATPAHVTPAHWATDRRTTVLVRPDGYVAWAAEAPARGAVTAAVAQWTTTRATRNP